MDVKDDLRVLRQETQAIWNETPAFGTRRWGRAYANLKPEKGLGIIGQPQPHYYFHRSISQLLGAYFREGFVLDGIEEPTIGQEGVGSKLLSWANYQDIPPVLVVRMRLSSR